MTDDVLTIDARAWRTIDQALRRLPYELRRDLRTGVTREIATPVARQVSLAAGAQSNPFARAFRSRGVSVKPGQDDAQVVVGGPEGFGSHGARMRTIAHGAEFGGGGRVSSYLRKNPRGKRGRSGNHLVRRRTTLGFGAWTGSGPGAGRFAYPTFIRELPRMTEAYLGLLERTLDRLAVHG